MDPASDRRSDSVTVLVRTNDELSPGSARDYIQWRENTTALPPIHPQGGTVFLYYNDSPGKEGEPLVYVYPIGFIIDLWFSLV